MIVAVIFEVTPTVVPQSTVYGSSVVQHQPVSTVYGPGIVTSSSNQYMNQVFNKVVPLQPEPPKVTFYKKLDSGSGSTEKSTTSTPKVNVATTSQTSSSVSTTVPGYSYYNYWSTPSYAQSTYSPYSSFLYCYRVPVQLQYLQ